MRVEQKNINNMSKLKQDKIPVALVNDALKVATEQVFENEHNWKLVRERDGHTSKSRDILWIEWNEEGRFKAQHSEPAIGRSLLMSPFNDFYTWQTIVITEIVEQKEDYIKFKTNNSVYELFKISKK